MVMRDASTPERTVLVVEDDDSIVMGLEMNLSAEGYRVVVARDGEETVVNLLHAGTIFDVEATRVEADKQWRQALTALRDHLESA